MSTKLNPKQVVKVFIHVTGGEVGATSSLAPKVGPPSLSPKKIGEDIAAAPSLDQESR
jgi:large subunit ribosomal protein L12e